MEIKSNILGNDFGRSRSEDGNHQPADTTLQNALGLASPNSMLSMRGHGDFVAANKLRQSVLEKDFGDYLRAYAEWIPRTTPVTNSERSIAAKTRIELAKEAINLPSISEICERRKICQKNMEKIMSVIRRSLEVDSRDYEVSEAGISKKMTIERRGLGILNTKHGKFWQYDFHINDCWEKYSVIVKAEIDHGTLRPIFTNPEELVMRIDSGCETGQVFSDLTCECRQQLHLALEKIANIGEGMVINIPRQDGRGMGLSFKLATLWLQDALGVNTVESATMVSCGGPIDKRTYAGVICILKYFLVPCSRKINLATNNPKKASIFPENGYQITEFTPVLVEPDEHTVEHLKAKQQYLGHKNLLGNDSLQ